MLQTPQDLSRLYSPVALELADELHLLLMCLFHLHLYDKGLSTVRTRLWFPMKNTKLGKLDILDPGDM